jgi:DNA-binding NarL/FixJ family response regulator
LVSGEVKGESEKLSSSFYSSSSLVATHLSSGAPSSASQEPSVLPANAPVLPEVTSTISIRPSQIQLAATLRKIRHLIAEGYTNKEIIELLQLHERTLPLYGKDLGIR